MTTADAICDLYARLLAAADHVLRQPYAPGREEKLEALREEIERAAVGPAEQRLVFDHERLLVQALLMAERGRNLPAEHAIAGKQLAGVLIPWVQEHAFAAMHARQRPVPTSDGADYARRPAR